VRITFWGVRGSIPTPGRDTAEIGGNTSCVEVRAGKLAIILDGGTGLRLLGQKLLKEMPVTAHIFFSHVHWDHIQGFPFFGPLYIEGNRFQIYGPAESSDLLEGILEGQMAPQYFPVQTLKNMGARIDIAALSPGTTREILGCRVTAAINPHGHHGAMAFRIEELGRSVVYASDAGYPPEGPGPEVLALYAGADLLIHDSTFTPEDRARYPHRGLASVSEAVQAAARARAGQLALFHYDQDYTDAEVDALVERARHELARSGASTELRPAIEGETISV